MTPDEVRAWRNNQGLSQAAVATKLGVTRGHYALWEQGRSRLAARHIGSLQLLVAVTDGPPARRPSGPKKKLVPPARKKSKPPWNTSPAAIQAATMISNAYFKKQTVNPDLFLDVYSAILRELH
jgi:transcriptional regulator with XRE-family HTH domain